MIFLILFVFNIFCLGSNTFAFKLKDDTPESLRIGFGNTTCKLESLIQSTIFEEIRGAISISSLSTTETYVAMCNCSIENPKFCKLSGKSEECLLMMKKCRVGSSFPPCCPINNGRSFCTIKTGRCEASRFCDNETSNCPFDDLSAEEMKNAVFIVKNSGRFPPDILFPVIRNQEPAKSDWNAGIVKNQRVAYVLVFNTKNNSLYQLLIDLNMKKVIKVTYLPDKQSILLSHEKQLLKQIILKDGRWQKALLRRNLNPNLTIFQMTTVHSSGLLLNGPGKRILRIVAKYYISKFVYWIPIEGILVTVDLNKKEVVEFLDVETTNLTTGFKEFPNFDRKPLLKPLTITQNEGSSIVVNGQEIQWYKWTFRYSLDNVHGLQLFHVRYNADCEDRLILYKISLGEMFVPYGASSVTWRWRSPLDAGDFGIGQNSNSLKIGLEVPENAILFDCILPNETGGEPIKVPGCIAAYERDVGFLYKHIDSFSGNADSRRGRQLVLTHRTTIGAYDYAFDYIFNMDGVIDIQAILTGIAVARGIPEKFNDPSCLENCRNILNDYLIGPIHQHFFSFRIDLDVEGINNYVTEVDVTNDPVDLGNPDGGAFSAKTKIIHIEDSRDYNVRTARTWHVVNANSRNKFSTPRGYSLKPGNVAYTYLHSGNPYLAHAEFVKHSLWVTSYKDNEQSSAGEFPRSITPGQGLPEFIANSESVKNSDSVLWYTFGVTHSPRPEEWPIMNVQRAGFSLMPFNFGSHNSEMPLKGTCP